MAMLLSLMKSRASATRQRTPAMYDSTAPPHQAVPGHANLPSFELRGAAGSRGPT
jgi:hypothetical protein